jgi:DNA (cytosine-5)-methyltransferase 1
MSAYYNEFDVNAAAWLRELVNKNLIAPGDVDTRSIKDVSPDDLKKYTQCHFFAGIGGWSYALRLAGWSDERPVWTGSCPCQPFSAAGKQGGFNDERHLWPTFFGLIQERRPAVVFGEQVASKDGLAWLDLVHADLEGAHYAVGAVDLCAAGIGAPHIRQRLWFVGLADAESGGRSGQRLRAAGELSSDGDAENCQFDGLADAQIGREQRVIGKSERESGAELWPEQERSEHDRSGVSERLADGERPSPTNGLWRDADWLFCRDGKWRPVDPSTFPLAYGIPARVGRLRGYGNAIVPRVAAEVIAAVMDIENLNDLI